MALPQAWRLLPPDLLELQIGQIDLLRAMYPDEVTVPEPSTSLLDQLRNGAGLVYPIHVQEAQCVSLHHNLIIPTNDDNSDTLRLCVNLRILFSYEGSEPPEEPPKPKIWIQQPSWLSKSAVAALTVTIPLDEDLIGTIEHIRTTATQHFETTRTTATSAPSTSKSKALLPLIRVWFYFPSISTRTKRDDFIIHAPHYSLTGFLYAGKPGLLCVEGTSNDIDAYMRFIKTESWGDVPSGQKKVSERLREIISCGATNDALDAGKKSGRVFDDMKEITDLGERRGARGNRGDLRVLEEWLVERGLGAAFAKVLM